MNSCIEFSVAILTLLHVKEIGLKIPHFFILIKYIMSVVLIEGFLEHPFH